MIIKIVAVEREKNERWLVERFKYGDIDSKISIFAKVLCHCCFKYETVIV